MRSPRGERARYAARVLHRHQLWHTLNWIAGAGLLLLAVAWAVSYSNPLTLSVSTASFGITHGYAFAALTSHPATTPDGIAWSFPRCPGSPRAMGCGFDPQYGFWMPHKWGSTTGMGRLPKHRRHDAELRGLED